MPTGIDQNLYDRVVAIVRKHTGCHDIRPESRIFQDLHTTGADARELMLAMQEEFDIEMGNFVFKRHFGGEWPFNPFSWLYWLIFDRKKLNASGTAWKMVPITIMDLYESAMTKKFPDLSERPAEPNFRRMWQTNWAKVPA